MWVPLSTAVIVAVNEDAARRVTKLTIKLAGPNNEAEPVTSGQQHAIAVHQECVGVVEAVAKFDQAHIVGQRVGQALYKITARLRIVARACVL